MSAGSNLLRQVDRLEVDSLIAKPFDLDALLADVRLHQSRARAAYQREVDEGIEELRG